ncbi:hypothetical protein BH11GEM2_BH11GEM2_20380 [soil metagenome]
MTEQRGGIRVRTRISIALICGLIVCAGLSACDPCSGVLGCSKPSDTLYLAADGQIVDPVSGVGGDGVRVQVVRRGGIPVTPETLTTVTANGGHWRVAFTPAESGFVDVDVSVTTSGGVSYTATAIRLTTSARGGDANLLDRWVAKLYFPNAGELFLRGTRDTRLAGAAVEFHRTGGIELVGSGAPGGVVRSATDFAGRVPLFTIDDGDVYTSRLGFVIGDLIVKQSATDSSVIRNLRVGSSYLYRGPTGIIRLAVGPSLAYEASFINRATGSPVAGVAVSFERLSGIELAARVFNTASDKDGKFAFPLQPLSSGVVQGRLIYRAPLAAAPESLLVTLPTFDSDDVRFYGAIRVGAPAP